MSSNTFTAGVVSAGPLEHGLRHVGWAEREDGDCPHVIIMRSDTEKPDQPCIVVGDGQSYGISYERIETAVVGHDYTELHLSSACAQELGVEDSLRIEVPRGHPDGFVAILTELLHPAPVLTR